MCGSACEEVCVCVCVQWVFFVRVCVCSVPGPRSNTDISCLPTCFLNTLWQVSLCCCGKTFLKCLSLFFKSYHSLLAERGVISEFHCFRIYETFTWRVFFIRFGSQENHWLNLWGFTHWNLLLWASPDLTLTDLTDTSKRPHGEQWRRFDRLLSPTEIWMLM